MSWGDVLKDFKFRKSDIATIRRIVRALSRLFNEDARMLRVCPFCHPEQKPPYFSAVCPEHAGVA